MYLSKAYLETRVTLTLLIDLDNTLLSNDMDGVFLPAYLQTLSQALAPYADPRALVKTLLQATQKMVENRRPDCTLIEVFNQAFYPPLGLNEEAMQAPIEKFYAEVFPTLAPLTQPRPKAVDLVAEALKRGCRLVVATNPLLPRAAVLHRLEWAGLPVEKYPFELITAVEQFHFSKPNPTYLAEILGYIGWPEGPVVMVGDDPRRDIQPARRMGLPAYWLSQGQVWPDEILEIPTAGGPLEGLLPWLDSQAEEALQPNLSLPGAILAVLRSTPAVLDGGLRSLPGEAWTQNPGPGEWSVTEVLCHLRDVEAEVNLPRFQKVLQEANPFLPGMDTDPWAEQRLYFCQDGPDALQRFTGARLKLLDMLENLPPESWERKARHAILGPTSLRELAGIIASHDRLHIQQIKSLL